MGPERQVHPVADVFHTIQSIAIRRVGYNDFLVAVNVTAFVTLTVTVSVTVNVSVRMIISVNLTSFRCLRSRDT